MTARLVLVRHGNTFAPGEKPVRIGARTDPPLTAEGWDQAHALVTLLRNEGTPFDRILAGSLRRTVETADILRAGLAIDAAVETTPLLTEIDHGPDEGQPDQAVRRRLGDLALDRWDAAATLPTGWIADVPTRLAGWRDLVASARSGSTLLVTSNGAARFIFLAFPQLARPSTLRLRTGAFAEIALPGPRLVRWNVRPPSPTQTPGPDQLASIWR